MWKNSISILLSKSITILYGILIILATPFIPKITSLFIGNIEGKDLYFKYLILILYSTIPFAMVLLFCLYCLLNNINQNKVFIDKNILLLRISSWCCFYSSCIYFIFSSRYIFAMMIATTIAFGGLIFCVIKNVLNQAIILKNENDFTIWKREEVQCL